MVDNITYSSSGDMRVDHDIIISVGGEGKYQQPGRQAVIIDSSHSNSAAERLDCCGVLPQRIFQGSTALLLPLLFGPLGDVVQVPPAGFGPVLVLDMCGVLPDGGWSFQRKCV